MKNLSRGAWIAIAAVAAVPATVAIAKNFDRGGWQAMSPETRARLDEGRIAMAKAALKLTPDQEKLWSAVETEIRAGKKAMEANMADRKKMREEAQKARAEGKDVAKPDMAERFERMSQMLSQRAERMKAFSGAFKPFYASLSTEQKDVLRPLMRDMMPGMGGRGHGGKRWAHGGGWGPGGHEGGFGRHRGHGRGGPGMGGPGMDGMGPGMGPGMGGGMGGGGGPGAGSANPQYAPDSLDGQEDGAPMGDSDNN